MALPTAMSEADVLAERRARVMAKLGQLPAAEQQEIVAKSIEVVEAQKTIWKGGIAPPRFDEFFTILDGTHLYPLQYKAFAEAGLLDPMSLIDEHRDVQEMVLAAGKGAGKDYVIAKFFAWIAYIVGNLEGYPALQFGLTAPTTKLSVMNIAPSEQLANSTFFAPYLSVFMRHPIFDPLKPKILTESVALSRIDEATGKPYVYLDLLSMHSNSGGLDGYNLLAWVMDEADGFDDILGKSTAERVHKILRSSCATRMGRRWFGAVISYIRVAEGFMDRLRSIAEAAMQAMGKKSPYFTMTAASWEWNLRCSREDPTIVEDYKNDPSDAAAKYECRSMATIDGFFEFPERIEQAVDKDRRPCAVIEYTDVDIESGNGTVRHYVSAVVENIKRTPGYTYFLGCDAGEKGDAFALCIGHVDDQQSAFAWLCPRCGRDPALRGGGRYDLMLMNALVPYDGKSPPPMCGACMDLADQVVGGHTGGKCSVANWFKRQDGDESVVTMPDGTPLNLRTIHEDLLVRVVPRRAERQGQVNRTVYFPGMLELCKDLINGLGIYSGRFDPWQTSYITQSLRNVGNGDFDEIKFGRADQYHRASLGKTLLYNGLLDLLPNDHRDREWRRLQRLNGNKIDHPPGNSLAESKDLFDAEMVMIWQACTYQDAKVEVLFA